MRDEPLARLVRRVIHRSRAVTTAIVATTLLRSLSQISVAE
jgi:hypothetical protein